MNISNSDSIPPWYKYSALGLIPNGWEIKKLGSLWEFNKGKGILKDQLTSNGLPCIRYGEIYTTYEFVTTKLYSRISEEVSQESHEIKSGDILFAGSGETTEEIWKAVAYIWNEKAFAWGDIIIFSPNEKLVSEYISYSLETDQVKKHKRVLWQWNSVVHIYSRDIEKLNILLPTLPEQTAIANLLSTWDEAISKVSKLIEQHENRKIWVMRELLTGRKWLSWFSAEWKRKRLGDIFERVTRKNEEKNTNVLTISAQRWLINQENFFNKQIASELLDNYFLLYKNEFAYNKSYSNGYPMWAIKRLNDYEKWVVTTLYICFRLKSELGYNHDFFEQYFENGLLIKSLEKIAHEWWRAHGLLNVTPSDFFNIEISIPEIEEQNRIAEILMKSDQEIQLLKLKLEKLKEQKKWFMQQLLTGKKRLIF